MVSHIEQLIRPKLPEQDEQVVFINKIIDHINQKPDLTKVDTLCNYFNVNKRTLLTLLTTMSELAPSG